MRAVRKFLRFMYPTSTVLLEPVLYWTIHKNFVNSFFNNFPLGVWTVLNFVDLSYNDLEAFMTLRNLKIGTLAKDFVNSFVFNIFLNMSTDFNILYTQGKIMRNKKWY